jgi:hypothetical protein
LVLVQFHASESEWWPKDLPMKQIMRLFLFLFVIIAQQFF